MPSGGYRPGAGRPRKNIQDKKLEGKAKPYTVPAPAPKKVYSKNVMADYFSMAMKECEKEVPAAGVLRAEIEEVYRRARLRGVCRPTDGYRLRSQPTGLPCLRMHEPQNRAHDQRPETLALRHGGFRVLQSDAGRLQSHHADYQSHSNTQAEERNAFLELLTNRGF
jgi:hypothetical protein